MGKKPSVARVYKKGDLIFAKMKGSPYWPARVTETRKDLLLKNKYNITFFGTHDTYVSKSEAFLPYDEETKRLHGQPRRQNSFNTALWEIEHDPKLTKYRKYDTTQLVDNKKNKKLDKRDNKDDEGQVSSVANNVVESLMNNMVEDIEKSTVVNGEDSQVSDEDGLKSFETFCKYIKQFECTKDSHIATVMSIFKNTTAQTAETKLALTPSKLARNLLDQIGNVPNMESIDDQTDQNIVDIVKAGVEVEEAIKSTN